MVAPVSAVKHVFRWDLDKTYLKTEFDTVRDIVRMARLTAEERENIPGSAALLRAIKASTPEPEAHGVYFISGSPDLIRAVIEKKFNLDGFAPDGFELKPTLSDVFRGRFRAVRGQVAYKLAHLLEGRAKVPVGTPETLFGDDAEQDALIYSLYADAVSGAVDPEVVLDVVTRAGGYPDQVDRIREHLETVVHEPAIRRIIIHLDRETPLAHFAPFLPHVVPISNHLQTAILLTLDGTLPAEVVRLVAQELLGRYGFRSDRLLEVATDILARRNGADHPVSFRELAKGLRLIDPARPPPTPRESRDLATDKVEETQMLLDAIAEAADRLHTTPPPPTEVEPLATRNYVELWEAELARAEAFRRARREAARAGDPTVETPRVIPPPPPPADSADDDAAPGEPSETYARHLSDARE